MKRNLGMKCPNCGCWNRVSVNKIFIEQETSEPKVKVYIPMYEPLEVAKCKKCGKIIVEEKELIRISGSVNSKGLKCFTERFVNQRGFLESTKKE